MAIDFIHDCTLVLYKQLIQTGFGCYPSDFTLCWDFLSTRTQILGEPPQTSSIALQQRLGFAPCFQPQLRALHDFLSIITKIKCSFKFKKYLMRDRGIFGVPYTLLFLKL